MKISIVIATYQPGSRLDHVLDSLAAQTMSSDEFEVIFVDDGSPDNTYRRLKKIARQRRNVRVHQIEHTGWPSAPRNAGIDMARGEYLLFMDHDDSLYPAALERVYEFARRHDSDVVMTKESKTSEVWWGMDALADGNLATVAGRGGITRLRPMQPHKLYRREMMQRHNIRFPEGGRVLWEDVFINVAAYRHAAVVSVLADCPVYLWHETGTNTTDTFDPALAEFWDRLGDVMRYAYDTLDGPDLRADRDATIAWEIDRWVILHAVYLMVDDEADGPAQQRGLARAQQLLADYADEAVTALLPRRSTIMARLIEAGDMSLIRSMYRTEQALVSSTRAARMRWHGTVLETDTVTRWAAEGDGPAFIADDGRVLLRVDDAVAAIVGRELLDVTDAAGSMDAKLAVRDRDAHITWQLSHLTAPARFVPDGDGLALVQHGRCRIDLDAAALGRALDDTVWDVRTRADWLGLNRRGRLLSSDGPRPMVSDTRAGVAYANRFKGLSIDLTDRLRSWLVDAAPRSGPAGPATDFSIPLGNLAASLDGRREVTTLAAVPAEVAPPADEEAPSPTDALARALDEGRIRAGVVVDDDGPRLEGTAPLGPGRYVLYASRDGEWHRTKRSLVVDAAGQLLFDW